MSTRSLPATCGLVRLGLAAALLVCRPSGGLAEDSSGAPRWLTGADLARERQQAVSTNWSGVALRDTLASLSRAQRVAVLLDRRIDPEQMVEFTANRLPLDTVLEGLAEKINAGTSWLGPLAYVGPFEAASRLRTVAALRAAEARALPKDKRAAFQREARLSWEKLAEPRRLAAALAAEAKIDIESLDLIGHDLWPAVDLPPLTWSDRLTLIANEFDLTFEIVDGGHVRLVPIAGPIVLERVYPGTKQPESLAEKWRGLAPNAQIEVAKDKIIVRGRLEDHELITQAKKPKPAPPKTGTEVYTLRLKGQPLSAVLDTLREQTAREILVDEAALEQARLSLDVLVSFSVERVTFDELLTAALKPAKMTFRREGKGYKIVPAPQ